MKERRYLILYTRLGDSYAVVKKGLTMFDVCATLPLGIKVKSIVLL
jgi:hypothetical protein